MARTRKNWDSHPLLLGVQNGVSEKHTVAGDRAVPKDTPVRIPGTYEYATLHREKGLCSYDSGKDPERREILLDYLGGPVSVLLRRRQEAQRERDLEKLRAGFGEAEEATSQRVRWLLEAGKGERMASPRGLQKHAGLSLTLM